MPAWPGTEAPAGQKTHTANAVPASEAPAAENVCPTDKLWWQPSKSGKEVAFPWPPVFGGSLLGDVWAHRHQNIVGRAVTAGGGANPEEGVQQTRII